MDQDRLFRFVLVAGLLLVVPAGMYYRVRSQATRERLDRWQEGRLILFPLRIAGAAGLVGLLAYVMDPAAMAWSSLPLPARLRWTGAAFGAAGGALLLWAFHTLGPNLTDTVVTRRVHTLVTRGPYRWVRHPVYDAVALATIGNALLAANWFIFLAGVASLTLLVVRTRIEEEQLRARFGDAYASYAARTGRFLPKRAGQKQRAAAGADGGFVA
jgi:protein-S-isoprenylcysteine O-methyltransferase Ste14